MDGDERILKVSDDLNCLSPQTLAGTVGCIESERKIGLSRKIANIARAFEVSAVEFDTSNDYKVVEVR